MRAVWYEENGPAEVLQLGDLPVPEAGPGEVLVRVVSSGINPSDWKRRMGLTKALDYPSVIPHQDGSGIIYGVGQGVPSARLGERVWLFEAQTGRPFGTAAEYTVQPADRAVPLPPGTGFPEGACLGVPAMTAHRCVFADGPVSGKPVLVTGGAGAVGNYAIQLAKLDGARVISTVSSDEKAKIAVEAGADHTVNYRTEHTVQRIMNLTDGDGVDLIVEVDFAGNFRVSREVLRANGVLAFYAAGTAAQPPVPLEFRGHQHYGAFRLGLRHAGTGQTECREGHNASPGSRPATSPLGSAVPAGVCCGGPSSRGRRRHRERHPRRRERRIAMLE